MPQSKTVHPDYAATFIASDVDKAVFLGSPVLDGLVSVVIALGAEVWTTRRRMMIHESLLAAKGVTAEMIETYVPSPAEAERWARERDTLVSTVFDGLSKSVASARVAEPRK